MADERPSARFQLLASAGLFALAWVVYWPVLGHSFVAFDSGTYVTANEHVASGISFANLGWAFTSFHAANWHPLTWISHQIDVQLFGAREGAHFAVNVLLHALNGVLLFRLLAAATARVGPSALVAALFVVHPLRVESVAWIVERKDLLSTLFGLLALAGWLRFARGGGARAYLAALLAFAAGLMSKPMLVTLPFVLLLCDFWPLGRGSRGLGRLVTEKLPFFALAGLSCWITLRAQAAGGAVQALTDLSLAARVENALASLLWYAGKSILPGDLSFYYPLRAAEPLALVGGIALVVLGAAVGFHQRARRPWIAWGLLFFAGTLVPVIGLVQVGGQAHADRYAYVPTTGLLVAAAFTLAGLVTEARARWIFALGVTGLFAFLAHDRVGAWRDSETLARRAVAVDPGNHVALTLLGVQLVERGEVKAGLELLDRALASEPGDFDARRHYARALLGAGRLSDAERELRRALALRPDEAGLQVDLGTLCSLRGSWQEAGALLARAVELAPDDPTARTALGEHLDRTGDYAGSEGQFRRATELAPGDTRARVDLAAACIVLGKRDEGRAHLDRALAVDSRLPQALQLRAKLAEQDGDAASAIRDLRAALVSRPGWALAQIDLAWLLATARDARERNPTEAVALATEAVNAGNQERAQFLDVLAAAYATSGGFEAAVKTAEAALRSATERNEKALATRIGARLAAYRERRMDLSIPR